MMAVPAAQVEEEKVKRNETFELKDTDSHDGIPEYFPLECGSFLILSSLLFLLGAKFCLLKHPTDEFLTPFF